MSFERIGGQSGSDLEVEGGHLFPAPTTTNTQFIPPRTPMFDAKPGDWPLVLARDEGLELIAIFPATSTWFFSVDLEWDEVSTFGEAIAA